MHHYTDVRGIILQLRVLHQALQGCAQACKTRIPKPV
jgi:hypothetical protein